MMKNIKKYLALALILSLGCEVPVLAQDVNNSSAETVSFEDVTMQSAISVEQLLVGKVAGLNTTIRSGIASQGGILTIRGVKSFNSGCQPLIVVDGMIYELPEQNSIISGHSPNLLANIDVRDIDNVQIIKNATGIYGAKGANGAVIITTKRANDLVTRINFSAHAGVNFTPKQLPMLSSADYRSFASEQLSQKGYTAQEIISGYSWLFADKAMANYPQLSNNTDWQKKIYDAGLQHSYHLGITGGDAIAKYAISVGYLNNENALGNTGFERYNTRLNGDLQITKRLRLSSAIAYTFSKNELLPTGLSEVSNPLLSSLIKPQLFASNVRVWDNNGAILTMPQLSDVDPLGISNPSAILQNVMATSKNNQFVGNVNFTYDINGKFSASAMAGINYFKNREDLFIPSMGIGELASGEYSRSAERNISNFSNFNSRVSVDYVDSVSADQQLKVGIGLEFHSSRLKNSDNADFSMPNDEFKGLGSGSSTAATTALDKKRILSESGQWKSASAFVSVNYSLKNRLFASLGASLESSSRFADNSAGIFGSLDLGWQIIPQAKLRGYISHTGNDNIGDFAARQYYVAQLYRQAAGVVKGNLENKDLKWEKSTQYGIGADFSLFDKSIAFEVDYYKTHSSDVIMWNSLDPEYGYDGYWSNNASIKTQGVELNFKAQVLRKTTVKLNAGFNISHSKSKIASINGGAQVTQIPGGYVISKEGGSLYEFYGYKSEGVYASTSDVPEGLKTDKGLAYQGGDMRYAEVKKDGVIDNNDFQAIGCADPKFYGGAWLNVSYKRITLDACFDFKYGGDIFNFVRMQTEGMTTLHNQSSAVNNRWLAEGQVTSVPRASMAMPDNAAFSSRWIEDGSYLRLRNITLSYDIPIKGRVFKSLRVYGQANNLFTLTKYLGSYPEFSYSNNPLYNGCDYFKMGQSATILFGVKIGL